jgi:tRNA uridine 5-carbamoylmethylation protein Kti12
VIILFCGIPGSGKTTTAKILAQRLTELGRVQLVSSDELRAPVYRKLLRKLGGDRRKEDFVIVDATFYKKEWRRQVKAQAGDEDVVTVYLDCPLEVALKRNQERQPNISARVVHIMFHKMEPPEHPSLRIDTRLTTPAAAAAKVFDLINSKRQEVKAAKSS